MPTRTAANPDAPPLARIRAMLPGQSAGIRTDYVRTLRSHIAVPRDACFRNDPLWSHTP